MFQFKEINNTIFSKKGYSGIGIINGKNSVNFGLLLRTAAIFGNDLIFTIGEQYSYQKADVTRSHLNIPTLCFKDFKTFKESLHSNTEIVGIEMTKKSVFLENFSHPERAMYLLGAEDTGIPEHVLKECHKVIKLPGKVSLNVGVTGSIVLYDRLAKRGNYENL